MADTAVNAFSNPSANTNTTLRTVGASGGAATVHVVNKGTEGATVRLSITPSGGTNEAAGQFLEYDRAIPPNESWQTSRLMIAASAVVRIRSSTANTDWVYEGGEF